MDTVLGGVLREAAEDVGNKVAFSQPIEIDLLLLASLGGDGDDVLANDVTITVVYELEAGINPVLTTNATTIDKWHLRVNKVGDVESEVDSRPVLATVTTARLYRSSSAGASFQVEQKVFALDKDSGKWVENRDESIQKAGEPNEDSRGRSDRSRERNRDRSSKRE